jgi:hypothetical protein
MFHQGIFTHLEHAACLGSFSYLGEAYGCSRGRLYYLPSKGNVHAFVPSRCAWRKDMGVAVACPIQSWICIVNAARFIPHGAVHIAINPFE